MTQDRIIEIVETVIPTVINKEEIPYSGGQFRDKTLLYFAEDGIVEKEIIYKNNVFSSAWNEIKNENLKEALINDIPTFRTITISNHPIFPEITRTVNLINTDIRKDKIIVLVSVKHSNEIPDILVPLLATNDMIIDGTDIGLSNQVGERDYWEYLTDVLKKDVYTLFDNRIPILDQNGRFNSIY